MCDKADLTVVSRLLGGPVAETETLAPGEKPTGVRAGAAAGNEYSCQWAAAPQTRTSRSGNNSRTETVRGSVYAIVHAESWSQESFERGAAAPVTVYCKRIQVTGYPGRAYGEDCVVANTMLSTAISSTTVLIGGTKFRCGASVVGNSASALRSRVDTFCKAILQASMTTA